MIVATLVFLLIFYELHILGEYTSLLSSQLFQSASGNISTYGTTDTFIELIRSYVYEYIQVFMGTLLFVGGIFFLKRLPVHQKWITVFVGFSFNHFFDFNSISLPVFVYRTSSAYCFYWIYPVVRGSLLLC